MEIIPHIKKAFKDAPDQPGLLTWVYPFRELHEAMAETTGHSTDVFFNDWFVRNAINQGLPLNTVLSTDDFFAMSDLAISKLQDTILFTSAFWLKGDKAQRIAEYVRHGGKILLYGAVEDSILQELLNLRVVQGLDGDFTVQMSLSEDTITNVVQENKGSRLLRHESQLSSGALCEVISNTADPFTHVHTTVRQNDQERVFALSRSLSEWNGGKIGWVRGSLPFQSAGVTHLPIRQELNFMDSSLIVRYLLAEFGYEMFQTKLEAGANEALLFVARHDNGFLFTGCKQDTSVTLQLRFPDGAPVITGQTTMIGEGMATYVLNRTFHDECRVFVKQKEESRVSSRENQPIPTPKKRAVRMITVFNLRDAEVVIYPPLEPLKAGNVEVINGDHYVDLSGKIEGNRIKLAQISGKIDISW
ncbi:MAG: hypothetical protein K0Q81_1859 [Paenibacillus sp.]|nr:hypothetical protein [Paenibacillus sp.]